MEKVHKIHFQQSTKNFFLSLNAILFDSTVGQQFFLTMKKVHLHLFKKFFKKYLTRQVSLVQWPYHCFKTSSSPFQSSNQSQLNSYRYDYYYFYARVPSLLNHLSPFCLLTKPPTMKNQWMESRWQVNHAFNKLMKTTIKKMRDDVLKDQDIFIFLKGRWGCCDGAANWETGKCRMEPEWVSGRVVIKQAYGEAADHQQEMKLVCRCHVCPSLLHGTHEQALKKPRHASFSFNHSTLFSELVISSFLQNKYKVSKPEKRRVK